MTSRQPQALALDRSDEKNAIKRDPTAHPVHLYTRRSQPSITESAEGREAGSLYWQDNQENLLFETRALPKIGQTVAVRLPATASSKSAIENAKTSTTNKATTAATPSSSDKKNEDDLAKDLKEVGSPSNPNNSTETVILMKIVQKLRNGDLLLEYQRSSNSAQNENSLSILAKLPYSAWNPDGEIATNKFYDIQLRENRLGEFYEQESTHWENEFTDRINNFDEVATKELEEFRRRELRLNNIKDRLQDRVNSLNLEKQKLNTEREKWLSEQKKSDEESKALRDQLEEQNKALEDQRKEIESMKRPEAKPGT